MAKNKRREAVRLKDIDSFHAIVPYIMPKRTEAEVCSTETFDITALNRFMKEHNEESGSGYKLFHAICMAIAKTIYWRPLLNVFISGRYFWKRNDITLSFVCKQKFEDEAKETLMFLKARPEMTLDDFSKIILGETRKARSEGSNDLDGLMDTVTKLPRFILEILFFVLSRLEYHGIMPKALSNGDPNYSTVLLSNLGSIRANNCYHHLSNYGTCSIMGTIGTMYKKMVTEEDGTMSEHTFVDMSITLDERIADGFYFAKSIRIARYMLEHPEELMKPISEPVPDGLVD